MCAIKCERAASGGGEKLDWGPSYSNQEIKQVLENCKARIRFHVSDEQRMEEAIQLLAAGKIWDGFTARLNSARARSAIAACWLLPGLRM